MKGLLGETDLSKNSVSLFKVVLEKIKLLRNTIAYILDFFYEPILVIENMNHSRKFPFACFLIPPKIFHPTNMLTLHKK